MIFDRTQNDVDTAIFLRDTKVKSFEELTESEIATLEKGTLTINTLNRIENKQAELRSLLVNAGIKDCKIENKQWTVDDIFNTLDFHRIIENLNILKRAFFVYSTTPQTPAEKFHFSNINDIEKILYDLEEIINKMRASFVYSNEIYAGEV